MKAAFNRARYREQSIKIVMIILLTFLSIYSCSVNAQSFSRFKYMGIESSFGNYAFNLKSDIKDIDNLRYGHVGGSVGVFAGNELWKARVQVFGYYCSDNNNPHTEDIYQSSSSINYYPLELLRTNRAFLHPYLTVGLSRTTVKYYGTYLNKGEDWGGKNEPFLGKVINYNAIGGLGLEMRLESDISFVHFFAEYLYGVNFSKNTNQSAFKNTATSGIGAVNIGVSFGCKKF